ncbi:MAG TPA: sialate O-acetylesterase [Cyclobacteriaceae bacterium]|nr:sialate O-acetylesterase [Cyclobacteriaceae bacterium]
MMRVPILFILYLILNINVVAQIRLPRLVSDGMILQRDRNVKIWGWSSPNESIMLTLNNEHYRTGADENGNWEIILPAHSAGLSYEMTLTGKNEIKIRDILFGDVWVCSGQSNMELTVERVKEKYGSIIENSENKNIRQFLVPDKYDFKKENSDLESGSWESANPKSVLGFSAVAYFFAREINEQHNVPVGLINSALGGSPVEAWISEDVLIKFPDLYAELQKFKDEKLIEDIEATNKKINYNWYSQMLEKDKGISEDGIKYTDPTLHDNQWSNMNIPGQWADGTNGPLNGSFWFRKKINVPASMVGKPARLWMGRIIDQDSVFVNGTFVGTTGYQYPPRRYQFGPDLLKEGENTIAVRVINSGGRGGFVMDKPYYLAVGHDTVDLKGTWKYKLGTTMPPIENQTTIRFKPAGLYNKMISPLLNYSIKGVIWYQGESNTSRAKEYEKTFPAMIINWRQKWNQGDFPFLFVQLANFMEPTAEAVESDWAELREAQRKTLSIPNTAMAVTIDLGEWNDIHPLNKKDVGKRLALAAEKLAYGNKDVVSSGPTYKSLKVRGNKITITFDNVGKGIMAKGADGLKYFSIAGPDKKFVWADTEIKGNKVIVWSSQIKNPVAVRYAWADNPQSANLYNKDGLPASPFQAEKK